MAGHLAWRILITEVSSMIGNFPALAKIEIRPVPNVTNTASGGTAYASSILFGSAAAAWSGAGAIANAAPPAWFAYIFPSPVECNQAMVQANVVYSTAEAPRDFTIQWSDDTTNGGDGTWTDHIQVDDEPAWRAGEIRTFSPAGDQIVELPQARVLGSFDITSPVEMSQARVLAVYNFPSDEIEVSQSRVLLPVVRNLSVETSQARVLAAVRGRVYNPKLRAWNFTLDGHDFYVLRLGEDKTLVYDLSTQQWSHWSTGDFQFWRLTVGMNWESSGHNAYLNGSNIVAGDDTFGLLWFLDPLQGYDQSPIDKTVVRKFPRVASAQMITRARETIPVFQVYLTADLGSPEVEDASAELSYSDDQGHSYVSAGSIEVEPDNYAQEFAWRSLGLITAPGRIFKLSDDGAFARIDGLEILNG